MNKDQERSFIARMNCDGINMTFFDDRLSPSLFTSDGGASPLPGNILTTFEAYDRKSQMMRPVGRRNIKPMIVHFQCYDDYYNMQILSELYCYKYFSKNKQGVLGAFPAAGGETTSFNLLNNQQQIITLDDLSANQATVHLKARHAGIIKKAIWRERTYSTCFTDKYGDIATFRMEILERHAVTPQRSTPYV